MERRFFRMGVDAGRALASSLDESGRTLPARTVTSKAKAAALAIPVRWRGAYLAGYTRGAASR